MSIQSLASIENKENGSTCPNCGEPLRVFQQANLLTGKPEDQADCQNPTCVLWMQTMRPDDLAALTPADIHGYKVAVEGRLLREGLERLDLFGVRW